MEKRKLSKSTRKFIRKEKARIRRAVLNLKEQNKLINELYQKIIPPSLKATEDSPKPLAKAKKQYADKRNLQSINK